MKCTTCDESLTPGTMFCPNCGARVPADSSAGAATTALPSGYGGTSSPTPQPYTPQPSTPQSYAPQPSTPQPYTPPPPNQYGMSQPQQWASQPGYMPAALPTSTAATVSLVFGILSWVILPILAPIVAVVAGHMARNEIRASNGQIGGSGLATAGLILGYLQIVLMVLGCIGIIFLGAIGAALD